MPHLGKFEENVDHARTSNDDVRGLPFPAAHRSSKTVDQEGPSQSQILSKEKDSDEEDMIGPPLPPDIAKGPKTATDDDVIGPPLPPGLSTSKDSDDEDEEEEEEVGIMSMHSFKMVQIFSNLTKVKYV